MEASARSRLPTRPRLLQRGHAPPNEAFLRPRPLHNEEASTRPRPLDEATPLQRGSISEATPVPTRCPAPTARPRPLLHRIRICGGGHGTDPPPHFSPLWTDPGNEPNPPQGAAAPGTLLGLGGGNGGVWRPCAPPPQGLWTFWAPPRPFRVFKALRSHSLSAPSFFWGGGGAGPHVLPPPHRAAFSSSVGGSRGSRCRSAHIFPPPVPLPFNPVYFPMGSHFALPPPPAPKLLFPFRIPRQWLRLISVTWSLFTPHHVTPPPGSGDVSASRDSAQRRRSAPSADSSAALLFPLKSRFFSF